MIRYVVGFALDEEEGTVLLVRKAKPEWQAGLLNGVGGKMEEVCKDCYAWKGERPDGYDPDAHAHDPGTRRWETPVAAMVREFHEETGRRLHADLWTPVAEVLHPDAEVHVFRCRMGATEMSLCRNDEGQGESLEVHFVSNVITETMRPTPEGLLRDPLYWRALANVPWLLALACYRGDTYGRVTVLADSAEVDGR
jgi:8-oxo-dGTP pyrophosphatase MutT (NUDIX family)